MRLASDIRPFALRMAHWSNNVPAENHSGYKLHDINALM
jgi:hypothetical protein